MSAFEWRALIRNGDSNYRLGQIPKDDGTMRELEIPKDRLKEIHQKIHYQLSLLTTPDYLHSGVKKRSSLTNGRLHRGAKSVLTMDVRKFYPSCTAAAICEFLRYRLELPRDIAEPLVSVVTYCGHIPTGSPLSQSLSFWSKVSAFDEIYRYAINHNLVMTLYVDDITLSSSASAIPGHTYTDVAGILKKYQLKAKQSKTRFYGAHDCKRVTGNILCAGGKIVAPNKLKKKLFKKFLNPVDGDVTRLSWPDVRSALGVLRTIRTVEESKVYPRLYSALVKQNKIFEELEAANALAAQIANSKKRSYYYFNSNADF